MKDLSVSRFKATIAACLREVQAGETLVITEHRRPVAEVHAFGKADQLVRPASRPFTLVDSRPGTATPGLWRRLLDEERGTH